MMDQEAIVARVEGDQAYVEVGGAGAGCGRCHEAGGCQSSVLGRLFRSSPRQFRILNLIDAAPGDQVIVRVASGATLRAALLTYVLPVLFLLLGAVVGTGSAVTGNNDVSAAVGALFGFAIGILAGTKARQFPIGKVAEPTLVRRNSSICIFEETRR